jgi:single-strand DNA-binding protein
MAYGLKFSLNKWTFSGNLGRDPELKYSQNGTPICNFSVAVQYSDRKEDGTYEYPTQWVRVTTFKELAEACNERLRKGSKIYVECQKKPARLWEDREGKVHAEEEVIADLIVPLDRAEPVAGSGPRQPVAAAASPADDEELPF